MTIRPINDNGVKALNNYYSAVINPNFKTRMLSKLIRSREVSFGAKTSDYAIEEVLDNPYMFSCEIQEKGLPYKDALLDTAKISFFKKMESYNASEDDFIIEVDNE